MRYNNGAKQKKSDGDFVPHCHFSIHGILLFRTHRVSLLSKSHEDVWLDFQSHLLDYIFDHFSHFNVYHHLHLFKFNAQKSGTTAKILGLLIRDFTSIRQTKNGKDSV